MHKEAMNKINGYFSLHPKTADRQQRRLFFTSYISVQFSETQG